MKREELDGQLRNLMNEQPADDTTIGLTNLHGLSVLLRGNLFCLFSDLRRSLRSVSSEPSYPDRAPRSCGSNKHCRPVRPVSPHRVKRTELNSHRPSLLELILP